MDELIDKIEGLIRWPKRPTDKQIVVKWLSGKFQFKQKYSEKEVNQKIKEYHSFNDIPLLRRELISRKFLERKNDGSKYWRNK